MKKLFVVGIIVAMGVGLAMLAGCGGGQGSVGTTGVLKVAITDLGGYDSVVVAIKEIRAVPDGQEEQPDPAVPVVATFDPPLVVDIMTLSFQQMMLGEGDLAVGSYHQLRLVLAPNVNGQDPVSYVIPTGGTEHLPLTTPSGQQSGLKINGVFTIEAGQNTTLVLEFDPSRAIVATGNGKHNLKPTGIRCTTTVMTPVYGALAGTIAPAEAWPTALVEAVPEGDTVATATTTVDPGDGSFRIPLPPGSYYLRVTATGYDPLDTSPTVYAVASGADTATGELTLTATP